MADRQSALDLAELAQLRTVLMQIAADEARRAADQADLGREALATAEARAEASFGLWSAHVTGSAFNPAMGRMMAAQVIAQDQHADRQRAERDRTAAESARRQNAFERAVAEEKVSKTLVREARQRELRRDDERNLNEVSDLISIRRIPR